MSTEQDQILKEAHTLLRQVFELYKEKGMLTVYFWGSITRDDFDPSISDIDSIAIVDERMDLSKRKEIRAWLQDHLSRDMKFGLQFYGLEELNGAPTYTLLGGIQPPGYLLLRFPDWIHVAGKKFKRSDFNMPDMSPKDAMRHQLAQVLLNLDIFDGRVPPDPRRNGWPSVYEDIFKGALGALYWHSVMNGNTKRLNYDALPGLVEDSLKDVAQQLVALRRKAGVNVDDIKAIVPALRDMIRQLGA